MSRLPVPNYGLALREDGDVVIESRLEGETVGEFNISKVMRNWLGKLLGGEERPKLKSV